VDFAHLVVCVNHRRGRVLDALSLVSISLMKEPRTQRVFERSKRTFLAIHRLLRSKTRSVRGSCLHVFNGFRCFIG